LLAAAPSLSPELVRLCRSVTASEGMTAVTQPPGLLVVRYLGDSGEAAREFFLRVWQHVRPALCERAAVAPRIWST
jgi:urease accessory protein